ncbi:hypothetical protein V8G54_031197 [Vigna mungo]|uniref:Uncharacterized protein n=1 Tax=Vigna mungo TaxID=3915 RepID=A0AAQ3MXW0_VIGMU
MSVGFKEDEGFCNFNLFLIYHLDFFNMNINTILSKSNTKVRIYFVTKLGIYFLLVLLMLFIVVILKEIFKKIVYFLFFNIILSYRFIIFSFLFQYICVIKFFSLLL